MVFCFSGVALPLPLPFCAIEPQEKELGVGFVVRSAGGIFIGEPQVLVFDFLLVWMQIHLAHGAGQLFRLQILVSRAVHHRESLRAEGRFAGFGSPSP